MSTTITLNWQNSNNILAKIDGISVNAHVSISGIFICFESLISSSRTAFKDSLLVIINAFGTIW